jgi:hypothetical protein
MRIYTSTRTYFFTVYCLISLAQGQLYLTLNPDPSIFQPVAYTLFS